MLYFPTWKKVSVLLVCLFGIAFAAPNLLSEDQAASLPSWLPHKQINLGLDLQGGAHVLFDVDVDGVIEERLAAIRDEARVVLRAAKVGYTGLGVRAGTVQLTLRERDQFEAALQELNSLATQVAINPLSGVSGSDIEIELNDQSGLVTLRISEADAEGRKARAVEQTIEIVRRRVDALGTTEPNIQRQGTDRILVQVPGLASADELIGIVGKTAKLNFRLVDVTTSVADAQRGRLPPGTELVPGDPDVGDGIVRQYVLQTRIMVAGEHLVDAQPTYSDGQPVVSFRFDSIGAQRFGAATAANVGRPMAVVLDGMVISAPRINSPILGGSGIITGGFTVKEANDLAILLRAGALPADLKVAERSTVGPELGADSIAAGKVAAVIGFGLVVIFVGLSYGAFGLIANISLFVNLALIAGVLSLMQATLTLPGIAGIVLTIGMAVDANVLIFERIREELRNGKTPISAVDTGYAKAIGTILDANITTLIAAVILFALGSGPIKGFAVTLSIGIVTSVFTAFTLSRLMVSTWILRTKPKTLVV